MLLHLGENLNLADHIVCLSSVLFLGTPISFFLLFVALDLVGFIIPASHSIPQKGDSLRTPSALCILHSCGDITGFHWKCDWFQLNFTWWLPEICLSSEPHHCLCRSYQLVGAQGQKLRVISLPRMTGYGKIGANATDKKVWPPTVR